MKVILKELRELSKDSRLKETKNYVQHGGTSCFKHTMAVAAVSCKIAKYLHIKVNSRELVRGAVLHDYFLYDWHEKRKGHCVHGFTHPYAALENASLDFKLTERERDIIKKHMFPLTPLPPKYRESILVCIADKYCSLLETFMKYPYRRRGRGRRNA